VDGLDPAQVLASRWADSIDPDDDDPEQLEMVAPFTLRFPGLALRQNDTLSPDERTAALAARPAARIGLIPASRPADVLALTGFNGTPAEMTAVLRSWEDRFGAALLANFRWLSVTESDRPSRDSFAERRGWRRPGDRWWHHRPRVLARYRLRGVVLGL